MLRSLNFVSRLAITGVLSILVSGHACATWEHDDSEDLKNDLLSAYGSSTGTLESKTYYVRGQVIVGGSGGGVNNLKQYIIGFPSGTGSVYIRGATPTVPEGASRIDKLVTRIVHGVIVGDDDANRSAANKEIKPWSALPSSDPWKNRFIQADTSNLCWVEFPATEDTNFSEPTAPETHTDVEPIDQTNWPTVTYKGIPLHYAEAISNPSVFDGYRWTWAKPEDHVTWLQSTTGNLGSDIELPPLGFSDDVDWSEDCTYALTFHAWDANCALTKATGVSTETTFNTSAQTWTSTASVALNDDPWSASTGGSNVDLSIDRRITLMNAPEFLRNQGDMVFNPNTKRIYFLCPSSTFSRGGITAPDPNLEANKFLEVAWPNLSNTANRNWGSPLVIGNGDGYSNRQVIIEDIVFGTGRAYAIDMQRMVGTTSNPVTIKTCRFRNQGHVGVRLDRCKNVRIEGCSFEDGLRGHLQIDAGRNFTKPYDSTPPISDVKDLVSDGIVVTGNGFYNGGLLWPYNGTVELSKWNIGTQITYNTFQNLSGIGIRIHGAKNLVQFNNIQDCVKDVTDYGAIYCGRSLVQLGNFIGGNTINGVKWRGRWSQTKTPNSLEDDVCGVYVDDYMCGTAVSENLFSDCQTGIMSNGGRFNFFYRNWFDSSVDYVLRTNVARNAPAAFRTWDESYFYGRSLPNQLYSEMRNVYMAIKAAYPNENVFGNSAWTTVQSQYGYDAAYHPVDEPDTKDLVNLVAHLNDSTSGEPTWANTGTNPFRMIYDTTNLNWFRDATSATISGYPTRDWQVEYSTSAQTILKNQGNVWVWAENNFANENQRPVSTHRVFFRSYRNSSLYNEDFMGDEVGYYSFHVPNTNGQD